MWYWWTNVIFFRLQISVSSERSWSYGNIYNANSLWLQQMLLKPGTEWHWQNSDGDDTLCTPLFVSCHCQCKVLLLMILWWLWHCHTVWQQVSAMDQWCTHIDSPWVVVVANMKAVCMYKLLLSQMVPPMLPPIFSSDKYCLPCIITAAWLSGTALWHVGMSGVHWRTVVGLQGRTGVSQLTWCRLGYSAGPGA